MALRLKYDPSHKRCPNFGSPAFAQARGHIAAAADITQEQVIEDLTAQWTVENDGRKAIWVAQQAQDHLAREEEEQQAGEAARQARLEAEEAAEAECKKPKMKEPDPRGPDVPTRNAPHPSPWALNKIKTHGYVPLWCASDEGCADAILNQRTVTEDAYGLTKVDNMVAFRPVDSFRASRNLIADENLTWRMFEIGHYRLLNLIKAHHWPPGNIKMLSSFFATIQYSEYCSRPNGECALLLYQAAVRREWHDALDRDEPFVLRGLNEERMREVYASIRDEEHAKAIAEVSTPPLRAHTKGTKLIQVLP
ncbi:hypothetical protein BOTBODRAFT_106316 [Botryobasidium botryosum FD-172 SS1]|uniref:Uncharacterized protein n=1 Tax=Botryobasidium botryosum (strain FD-172 SS1) TaxID=930990 RepID=A0A067MZL3_BOTB1|nr:hypothetical protein BOTBODRAFT_106316 [Botryobasidium botryosum FD-172 SS1]